jgi:hypothetical protein
MTVAIPCHFLNYTSATASLDKWKVIDVGSLCHIPYSLLIRKSFNWLVNNSAQIHMYIGATMAVYSHRTVICHSSSSHIGHIFLLVYNYYMTVHITRHFGHVHISTHVDQRMRTWGCTWPSPTHSWQCHPLLISMTTRWLEDWTHWIGSWISMPKSYSCHLGQPMQRTRFSTSNMIFNFELNFHDFLEKETWHWLNCLLQHYHH